MQHRKTKSLLIAENSQLGSVHQVQEAWTAKCGNKPQTHSKTAGYRLSSDLTLISSIDNTDFFSSKVEYFTTATPSHWIISLQGA